MIWIRSRIVSTIKRNLKMKGLKKTSSNPDLYVNILSSTEEKININVYSYGWTYWHGDDTVRGGGVGRTTLMSANISRGGGDHRLGRCSKKNILVWQGQGGAIDIGDLERKNERIKAVIDVYISQISTCNPKIKVDSWWFYNSLDEKGWNVVICCKIYLIRRFWKRFFIHTSFCRC
ncbi:MAG: DUF4136 domain-containing protein [Flavobacteriales bacterium AspAUS03]